jgi:apolipoprotein N-acyltransferase
LSVLYAAGRRRWAWRTFVFGFLWHFASLVWLATLIPFNPFMPLGVVLLPLALAVFMLFFAATFRLMARRLAPVWWPAAAATAWVAVEYLRSLGPFAFPWNFVGHSQSLGNAWGCQIADHIGVYGLSWIIVFANGVLALALWGRFAARSTDGPPPVACRHWRRLGALLGVLLAWQFLVYPPLALSRVRAAQRAAQEAGVAPLAFAILQPNIRQTQKMRFYTAPDADSANHLDYEMTQAILTLLDEATTPSRGAPPQFVVLPESAFNSNYFVYDAALHTALEARARLVRADFLFGADRREPEPACRERLTHAFSGHSERRLPALDVCSAADGTTFPCEPLPMVSTVAAWFVDHERGLLPTVYDKIRLVPFGETAPILDRIPYFQEWILMVGSYARGSEYTIFRTHDLPFGVMICFESVFADLARAYARRDARFLCVITNDGWYDLRHLYEGEDFWRDQAVPVRTTSERLTVWWGSATRWIFRTVVPDAWLAKGPVQHLAQAALRAIETRLPVLRSANTGISAFIAPDGQLRQWAPWAQRTIIRGEWRFPPPAHTLLTRVGDWAGALCTLIVLGAWLAAAMRWLRARPRRSAATPPSAP